MTAVVVAAAGGGAAAAYAFPADPPPARLSAMPAKLRVVAPDTLAGRPRNRDRAFKDGEGKFITSMKATLPNLTSVVGTHYGSAEKDNLVLVVAGASTIPDPGAMLDEFFREAFKIVGVRPTESGPLGGVARCGSAKSGRTTVGICAWADRGSLGVVYFYNKSVDLAEAEFVQIRGEIEQA
jgi:hypothetical protein